MTAFHQRDGWYFTRLDDGAVEVVKRVGTETYTRHVIPPVEWASIVAHVSAQGGTAEAYTAAEQLHGRGLRFGVLGLPQ